MNFKGDYKCQTDLDMDKEYYYFTYHYTLNVYYRICTSNKTEGNKETINLEMSKQN